MILALLLACAPHDSVDNTPDAVAPEGDLDDRAYVVSELSNEMFVFDTKTLQEVASVDTSVNIGTPNGNHMAMVSADGKTIYVSAPEFDQLVVVDAATLTRKGSIPVGDHNTHMALRPDSTELWLMNEGDSTVSVIDTATNTVTHTISDPSFDVPHFAHFSDGYAYVPSIGGDQISVVDLDSYQVVDTLLAHGATEAGPCAGDPCGFADAQIAPSGVLYASHIETGTVLVYNTLTHERLPDVEGLSAPWSAFVNPFSEDDVALVPSWGQDSVWRIRSTHAAERWDVGDDQVYGVNYSPTSPDEAFVLNRVLGEVAVVDRSSGALVDSLDVGGSTETATTTPEGLLLLPVSSAGKVLVIDTATHETLATFEDVGSYPWSVATTSGQNYCH